MNALLAEWISKAEGDYLVAQREMRVRSGPSYDAICFHCQQMVEKYMKAFLYKSGVDFPKTHNLLELLELQRDLLLQLDRYGVRYRYPGVSAIKDDARFAFNGAVILRDLFRMKLEIND